MTPRKIPVDAWLYQTRLTVDAGGADAFLPVTDALVDARYERDDELRRLQLQYRDRLEFAIGRTCSVDWDAAPAARRATSVRTTWLPTCETSQTTAEEVDAALLDMTMLATASRDELVAGLTPIVTEYQQWLDGEQQRAAVPGSAPAPGRVRAVRMPERDPTDPRRGVEPVVPRDAVGDRDAGVGGRAAG